MDNKSQGYVYNPVNDTLILVRDMPPSTKNIFWDQSPMDKDTLVTYDGESVHTFMLDLDSVTGPEAACLGSTKIPLGQHPVLVYAGEVSLQTQSGKLVKITLATHDISPNINDYSSEELRDLLKKNLELGRFSNGWAICDLLNSREDWDMLASAALKKLEVDLAVRVYRHVKNVSMVWSLEEIRDVEDRKLLAGHVSMIIGDYNHAQDMYLQSSLPVEALHLRRDLLQWDQALTLADKLAPGETPTISREYGQQLEFTGDYPAALLHYERGLLGQADTPEREEHNASCKAGIARMALRCGDMRKGLAMCQEVGSRQLLRECGDILEAMKQLSDAAQLYESAQYYDKAAHLYIKLKNWAKVRQLTRSACSLRT